jgi:protein-tyrosine phosphatase
MSDPVPADVLGNGRIWIGSAGDARNVQWLLDQNITHVVNCGPALMSYARHVAHTQVREVLILEAEDETEYPILTHLDTVSRFCDNALKNPTSRILFHCIAGINRSVTLALAYATNILLKEECQSEKRSKLEELLVNVRRQRPVILTNKCFYKQLIEMFM